MENLTVSVSDAIALINQTLDYAFPTLVIEGEVASFKVNQGKFVFFDLKDDEGTLGCFMMLFQLRTALEDGMRVRVVATPKVTAWGKFSLTVRDIQPVGEGSLKRAFKLLRAKLENEGLFAEERKRALPELPQHIAVISSTQAAGYADFIRILNERWGGLDVEVAHVQVQGFEAPKQMVRALQYFNGLEKLPEIIVIIRGGGSADDLSAFNDEVLVRAIAASRIPTVVGVGHEVDESLVDFAADVRAATPSHAAQIIVPDRCDIIRAARHDVVRIANVVDGVVAELSLGVKHILSGALQSINNHLLRTADSLSAWRTVLHAYDPQLVLSRGYAIIRGRLDIGGMIEVEQAKRYITAEVKDVRQK